MLFMHIYEKYTHHTAFCIFMLHLCNNNSICLRRLRNVKLCNEIGYSTFYINFAI